jgi:alcohol dehydrogenase (NADP+)
MAVKLGASFGAEVTMLSSSPSKEADAKRLGAHHFELTSDPNVFKKLAKSFHFIIDTVSARHDVEPYLSTLKTHGYRGSVSFRSAGVSPVLGSAVSRKLRTWCI